MITDAEQMLELMYELRRNDNDNSFQHLEDISESVFDLQASSA